ncbi:MAG TPA: PIG-L family deacetylase, partial [Thermoanaerobaculia bacterium]|nr:PIG-L family deacetylase [Thermoanaerobaculia bacterium]
MAVDILAISAHADDVELTCAGTLIQMHERGYRFGILDLTRGEMGTRGSAEIRAKESAHAAQILGAEFRETLDLGDGGLRTGREEELAVI